MKLLVEIAGRERSVDTTAMAAEEVQPGIYSILRDGRSYELRVTESSDGALDVYVNGSHYVALVRDSRRKSRRRAGISLDGPQNVLAPMPGKVVRFLIGTGDEVAAGQGLVVVEAMKMQNEIKSPKTGTIVRILAAEGATVNSGQVLLTVE